MKFEYNFKDYQINVYDNNDSLVGCFAYNYSLKQVYFWPESGSALSYTEMIEIADKLKYINETPSISERLTDKVFAEFGGESSKNCELSDKIVFENNDGSTTTITKTDGLYKLPEFIKLYGRVW